MNSGLTLIGLAAVGAGTNVADWRLSTVAGTAAAIFIDVANIATTPNNHREAEKFFVLKDEAPGGVAALRARVDVDCTGHRQRNLHFWALNESNVVINDYDPKEDWSADAAGTSAEELEKYICSGGASNPSATSAGSSVPIGRIRAILNKPTTG